VSGPESNRMRMMPDAYTELGSAAVVRRLRPGSVRRYLSDGEVQQRAEADPRRSRSADLGGNGQWSNAGQLALVGK
jgi:hypothetical protein